ncbi:hypothetical protein GCM10009733_068370 [Nonomuraea maheshkhaliensis]|uniref:Uncharacterized protein n=1 Tax=Nonomuraea maheshkhaliensis TaxID=419590 RepID=A0ABP4RUU1_9ACTN
MSDSRRASFSAARQSSEVRSSIPASSRTISAVIGVRNSWEASETNRRCLATASSSRASVSLTVVASSATSSSVPGTSMRRPRSSALIRSRPLLMRSTGARTWPTPYQAPQPISASSTPEAPNRMAAM